MSRWIQANTVGTYFLSACGVGLILLGLEWKKSSERLAATQEQLLESISNELRAQRVASWAKAETVQHNCYATHGEVTCTFSNLQDKTPITTCVRGVLAQNGGGASLKSVVMCTGSLQPLSTRVVSAPWVGGFAADICSSHDRWGNDRLDWTMCSFRTEEVGLNPDRTDK